MSLGGCRRTIPRETIKHLPRYSLELQRRRESIPWQLSSYQILSIGLKAGNNGENPKGKKEIWESREMS
jgi:hypothetical protein